MIDTTLQDILNVMVKKEKKIKEFKKRLRIKGKLIAKSTTKKGNITLKIKKDENEYKFTVLKSHKERFALAEKLTMGRSVAIEGINKFRIIICTRLKILEKGIQQGKQAKLQEVVST